MGGSRHVGRPCRDLPDPKGGTGFFYGHFVVYFLGSNNNPIRLLGGNRGNSPKSTLENLNGFECEAFFGLGFPKACHMMMLRLHVQNLSHSYQFSVWKDEDFRHGRT